MIKLISHHWSTPYCCNLASLSSLLDLSVTLSLCSQSHHPNLIIISWFANSWESCSYKLVSIPSVIALWSHHLSSPSGSHKPSLLSVNLFMNRWFLLISSPIKYLSPAFLLSFLFVVSPSCHDLMRVCNLMAPQHHW